MAKCKKCGSTTVEWLRSRKGTFYLVNTDTAGAYKANDFHSQTCNPTAQPIQPQQQQQTATPATQPYAYRCTSSDCSAFNTIQMKAFKPSDYRQATGSAVMCSYCSKIVQYTPEHDTPLRKVPAPALVTIRHNPPAQPSAQPAPSPQTKQTAEYMCVNPTCTRFSSVSAILFTPGKQQKCPVCDRLLKFNRIIK